MSTPRRYRRPDLVQLDRRAIYERVRRSLGDMAQDIEVLGHTVENLDVQTCAIFADAEPDELLRGAVALRAAVLQIHASTSALMATAGELVLVADLHRLIEAAGPVELDPVIHDDQVVKQDYTKDGEKDEDEPEPSGQ